MLDRTTTQEWVAGQFPDPGDYGEAIRSAARAALAAGDDSRERAFIVQAGEAMKWANLAAIDTDRVSKFFTAIAERTGLVAEIGGEAVAAELSKAIDGVQELAETALLADNELRDTGRDEPPPPAGIGDYDLPDQDPAISAPRMAGLFHPIAIDQVKIGSEPQWLVAGLIPARGLVAVIGAPKCGKSYLTTDMLFAVARDVPYAGRAVLGGPIVYATGEGVQGFKRRAIAMRRHYGVEGQGVPFFMVENVPDLGSERTNLAAMIAEIDEFLAANGIDRPRAIALDTLARCMGEGDESSARDMGRFIARCGEIERHYGCVVILVHHMGKDANRGARGSNALNGALDVNIEVDKGEAFSTANVAEMKDGPEGQEWRFRLAVYQDDDAENPPEKRSTDDPPEALTEASTCIVELLSEPTTSKHGEARKAKVPSGVAGDFLKVIRRAIDEAGEVNVDGMTVPPNVRAASRANLKNYCRQMDWQDPDGKADAFRAALSRNLSKLRDAGLIGFSAEWVWLT